MNKNKERMLRVANGITFLLFSLTFINQAYSQAGLDLQLIEDFEKDSVWVWEPWTNRESGRPLPLKVPHAAHSGKFGLWCNESSFVLRRDKQIGLPGEAISWWVRFQSKTRANCGFGIQFLDYETGYYLCVDPSTNTLHFAKSADYTYPLLKVVNQIYKLNMWYRVEVTFNTTTNITGRLYSSNGKTLLNSITLEIPDLAPGGIAFRGLSLHLDDIRGGTRQLVADTSFAPELGEPLILKNIVFESNKSVLLQQSFVELNKLVAYLKRNQNLKVSVIGHTDNIGNEDDNKKLSEARAKAVADYLIRNNINRKNVSYIGLGSSTPIATNDNEEGRKKNRRVACIINY